METFREFIRAVPLVYRFLLSEFFKVFTLTLLGFAILISLGSVVFFINLAKNFDWFALFEYILGNLAVYLSFFFPILVLSSIALTLYLFLSKKLNWLIFSMGISSKSFALPIATLALIFSLFLGGYFEFIYPLAGSLQHRAYLIAKNKPIQTGIVQEFWYKIDEKKFLYFSLINLNVKRAFGGKLIELNNDFQIEKILVIPRAVFKIKNDKILVKANNLKLYTFDRIRKVNTLHLKFPYNPKLLKVRKPDYFSLSELLNLIIYAKSFGLNFYPYLWEFIKRLLIVITTFVFFIAPFLKLFGSINLKEFGLKLFKYSAALLGFYIYIGLWQTLVNKSSINPLWSLLILIPYSFWLWKVVKEES